MSLSKPPVVTQQPFTWEFQTPATLSRTSVTQNAWYTILDTATNVRIHSIDIRQTNDQANAKSIRVKLTVDGNVIQSSLTSIANNTNVLFALNKYGDSLLTVIGALGIEGKIAVFAKSAKVEVQFGDVPGTNQALYGYVVYDKLKSTTL